MLVQLDGTKQAAESRSVPGRLGARRKTVANCATR